MPRSFDVVSDSAASVEQIRAAFARADYWQARVAGDESATLDSLVVDDDGIVTVRIIQQLGRRLLPAPVARVVGADLKLVYCETWQPVDDGHARGESTLSAAGLGSSQAKNWLVPTTTGSQLRSAIQVQVKIPFVGGTVEKTIGAGLAESIPATLRFTNNWINEHS
ncbi:DUF2505 domain-containing protein [Mycolicibacterium sarraceniae]|uniref:DUF2505 domain-containing protein n=1 Tax=Mycolicibacterium sarraceniae TaxID=1534348 RepID=A0A7I7SS32_9MYCO|nr:DUF2505 domain-containing protein [Mycolicibacterium sarraceniae]BBY59817.1 hypothetical protein MSAR_29530 [Mycolicibacterium sarraceniae]